MWNFIGLFVITYSDSRRATFLKHQVIMTLKKIVKFECYTGITSSQSLSMALTLFYRFHQMFAKEVISCSDTLFIQNLVFDSFLASSFFHVGTRKMRSISPMVTQQSSDTQSAEQHNYMRNPSMSLIRLSHKCTE